MASWADEPQSRHCVKSSQQAPTLRRTQLKFKKIALGTLAVLAVAGVVGWFSLDKETRGLLATVPTNRDLLF